MTKRAIPSNRVFSDIDDYLSYYHAPERSVLSSENQLHSFISQKEEAYFEHVKSLMRLEKNEDQHLSEEQKKVKYTHQAFEKLLREITDDLKFQF